MASDFPLGQSTKDSSSVFILPYNSRPEGVVIIGQNGFGKSSCIDRMVEQDRREQIGSIVVDPKGDLVDKLQATGNDKTILVSVDEDFPFGINPYEVIGDKTSRKIDRTVNNVTNLFKKVFGDQEFHPNIELVVRTSARMIVCNDLTMAEVPYIFGSQTFRNELMKNVQNKQVEVFWAHWDSLPAFEKGRLVQPLIARLNAFLEQEWLYRALSQRQTTVPFDLVFKEGYTLLIKLPREDEELTDFLGAVFVSLLSQYVWRQNEIPEGQRGRIHIYIDEYAHFGLSSTTAMFFKEARGLNISTLASLQILSDIKDLAHREALMNAGSFILFQLTGNDAEDMVKNLTVPPDEPKIDARLFAITREPVKYLVEHGHQNPAIQFMVETYIRPMCQILEEQDKRYINIVDYCLAPGWRYKGARDYLDLLLRECMDHPTFIGSEEYYEYIRVVASCLQQLSANIMPEAKPNLLSYIKNPNPNDLEIIKNSFLKCVVRKEELKDKMHLLAGTFNEFLDKLKITCKALAKDPIRIPTGAVDIELLGKQVKSFADRRAELAHTLATLPRYTAYIQTHDAWGVPQEDEIRLYAPQPSLADKTMIKRIQEASRQYTRKWVDVETEIEERQAIIHATLQTTPPVKKTPSEPDTHPWVARSEIFYPQ